MAKYKHIFVGKDNPRSNSKGFVHIHIAIAEKALGHYLESQNEVHHIDENKYNNKNNNLVICEDAKYHRLLHHRTRILRAGGDPNVDRICGRCKLVKPKIQFNFCFSNIDGRTTYCKLCDREAAKETYFKNKIQQINKVT